MPVRWGAGVFVVALRVAACTDDRPACYEGEYTACSCAGGARGYAVCRREPAGYAPCVCDGSTPGVDASTGATDASARDAEASDGGTRALFEPCLSSADCASALCNAFGDGRSLCTKTCATATDCPPPSPGCNGMGLCRP